MGSHDQSWPPTGGQQPGTGGWQQPAPQQFPGTGPMPPMPQGYPQGTYPSQPGYPPQPGYQGYPPAPFGAPGPKRRKPWPWLIPLIVVVVAAAVVVPIVLTRGGGSANPAASGPQAPRSKPWMVTAAQTGLYLNGFGAWANGDNLIAAAGNAVTAYKRSDGSKVWSVPPPMPGALYCGASRNVSGDRLAVAYGVTSDNPSDQACTNLGVINLETGKFVWSEQYLQASSNPPAGVAMEIVGNNLFAGFNLANLVTQVDLTTGKTKSQDNMSDGNNADCSINDITANASTVYYLATCEPGGMDLSAGSFDAVRAEDVNTGAQTGFGEINGQNAQLPTDQYGGLGAGAFISASPVVVQTTADTTSGQSNGSFAGLDAALHVTWAVPGPVGDPNSLDILALGNDSAGWTGFGRAFVADGVLLAETTFQNPSGYQNNKIVAIDAKTGKEKWRNGMPNTDFVGPFAVNGSSVLAIGQTLKPDASDNPGTVLANFDINSGKLTSSRTLDLPVKGTSDSLANEADLEGVWWVAADNRIYGATTQNGATTPPTMPEVFAVG